MVGECRVGGRGKRLGIESLEDLRGPDRESLCWGYGQRLLGRRGRGGGGGSLLLVFVSGLGGCRGFMDGSADVRLGVKRKLSCEELVGLLVELSKTLVEELGS